MFKLARYLGKYTAFIVMAVILLFGQAILDLNLPNAMSKIVNIGIQRGGIEEVAPKAIAPEVFTLLQMFAPEDLAADTSRAYTPYTELTPEQKRSVDREFPDAKSMSALVLTAADADLLARADQMFATADYAFLSTMQLAASSMGGTGAQAAEQPAEDGASAGIAAAANMSLDVNTLQQVLTMLESLPPDTLASTVQKAADTPALITEAAAAVLNKSIYKSLGANTDMIQTLYILKTGGFMLLLSLGVALCAVGAGFFFSRIGAGMARDLRYAVFAKVNRFSKAEMDKFSTASLITRTTNDITQVQMMYTMGMRFLVYAPIMGVGGVVMALSKSVGMSWIIALAVLVILGIIGVLFAVVMPKFKLVQTLIDKLSLVARENLTGIMVVRAFSNQDFQQKRFDAANKDLTKTNLFVGRAMALMMPLMMLVMNALSLLIIWVGGKQIAASALQVGDMMAFIQYAMMVVMSFLFIAMISVMLPRASVSAERINEVLQCPSTVRDPKTPATFGGRAKGAVQFDNVSFRYAGAEQDVLSDISFTAKPGETTAIIGSTGSGKSTLVNLIPRFYDVTGGSVTIDGVDVRTVTQHELRENIGFVPQKGLLFSGDISDNIRFGKDDASYAEVRAAAEVAQATEFIDNMDDGFETPISQGGTNVSGGQRQRISIARALVLNAPVYVFDDSFSALDYATEAKLRAQLKPKTKESAVIVVAQRVASIMHAEQIIVMDQGKIVGKGTHRELLKTCETYREIASSQLSEEELA